MIEASEITGASVNDILRLKVRDDQTHLVASNVVTIAQAHFRPNSWFRGLWADGKAVGLLAMIDLPDSDDDDLRNAAYLWRLMIDMNHPVQGYPVGSRGGV